MRRTPINQFINGDGSQHDHSRSRTGQQLRNGALVRAKEYEQQYSQALAELRSRGYRVASPYTAPDGIRRVEIDNDPPCTDRLVFEKAWGLDVADKIMMHWNPNSGPAE